jgi:hypothetical protein
MRPDVWKLSIRAALEQISDEGYQRLAWFNSHEEVSSPDELICRLYDDFRFESFTESAEIGLSIDQKEAATQFSGRLLKFCHGTPSKLGAREVIDDPRWVQVRCDAGKLVQTLFG